MLNDPINNPWIMGNLKSHGLLSFSTQTLNSCSLHSNKIIQKRRSKLEFTELKCMGKI